MKTKKSSNSVILILFSFLLLLYLNGCAATKQEMLDTGMKQLTTEELKSLFSEKRIAKVLNTKKTKWYTYTYLPDGSLSISRHGKTRLRVYDIKNDQVCIKKKPTSHKEICSSWLKTDSQTYNTYGSDDSQIEKQNFQ